MTDSGKVSILLWLKCGDFMYYNNFSTDESWEIDVIAIPFTSGPPLVARLITSYNASESENDPEGLQITLDEACEAFSAETDEGLQKCLSVVIAFCQLALAEISLATALAFPGDPEIDVVAERGLAGIRSMEEV
jgi:hypothetical protein